MGYVNFLNHFLVLAVVWFVVSILIGAYLCNDGDDIDEAMHSAMFLSTLVCAAILGIIYW